MSFKHFVVLKISALFLKNNFRIKSYCSSLAILSRGVVQLFNAVREQQKDMKSQLKQAGGSFRKQEKVFKSLDKSSFVEMLTGKKMSKSSDEPSSKKAKIEVKDEEPTEKSTWSILRDDYMLGAKLKDWDKESDGEN